MTVPEGSGEKNVTITVSPGPDTATDEKTQFITLPPGPIDEKIVKDLKIIPETGKKGDIRTLSFTPVAVGSVLITIIAQDDGGTENGGEDTSPEEFTITIVPCFSISRDNVEVLEDFSGTETVTVIPADDVSGQSISYSLSPQSVDFAKVFINKNTGEVTIMAVSDGNGTQMFTIIANDGQSQNSICKQSFTLIVKPVNDPPRFDEIKDVTVFVDSGPNDVTITVSPGPDTATDEENQFITLPPGPIDEKIVKDLKIIPEIGKKGDTRTLSFTPVAVGSVLITIIAQDDGGTENDGEDTSPEEFTITIVPCFSISRDNVEVLEDFSGTETVTVIPADDVGGQSISYSLSPQSVDFAKVSIDKNTGEVTLTAVSDGNGTQMFTIIASDSQSQERICERDFTLIVESVNDAPSFGEITVGPVLEDSGKTDVIITGVSPGPENESHQKVALIAESDNPSIVPNPTITGEGETRTLSFTPVDDANTENTLSVTITVRAQDDGGSKNNGKDTFESTFKITIPPVNDLPSFGEITVKPVLEDSGKTDVTITGVSPGPENESHQKVNLSAKSDNPSIVPNPTITPEGETRTLSFTPEDDAFGTVSITIKAQDDGGTANRGKDTFTRTFQITVENLRPPKVTKVDIEPEGVVKVKFTAMFGEPLKDDYTFIWNFLRFSVKSNFQIDLDTIIIDLDQNIISEELRQQFESNELTLSPGATPRKLEKGGEWQIDQIDKTYMLQKTDEQLDIYEKKSGPMPHIDDEYKTGGVYDGTASVKEGEDLSDTYRFKLQAVLPGDADNNGTVNASDILPLGRYWKEDTKRRRDASVEWQIQLVDVEDDSPEDGYWDEDTTIAYADTNGDGKVNAGDIEAIAKNWRNTSAAPPRFVDAETPSQILQIYKEMLTVIEGLQPSEGRDELRAFLLETIAQIHEKYFPEVTELLTNYPNPFNPETWIPYQLATDAHVTIRIYAASGQLVRTLMLGHKPVGYYRDRNRAAHWEGKNVFGESVASGVYFYTLEAGEFYGIKKMAILK